MPQQPVSIDERAEERREMREQAKRDEFLKGERLKARQRDAAAAKAAQTPETAAALAELAAMGIEPGKPPVELTEDEPVARRDGMYPTPGPIPQAVPEPGEITNIQLATSIFWTEGNDERNCEIPAEHVAVVRKAFAADPVFAVKMAKLLWPDYCA